MTSLRAGLIGDHISQTRLPAALDIMCRAHGIKLQFDLIDTAERVGFDFARTVDGLRAKGQSGVTVTHPYKTHAARYAGDGVVSGLARLGACNTLVFGPTLSGHNTDYTGFLSAWRSQMAGQTVGRVALAGAGGVARAIGPALAELGATDIKVWDTSPDRAADLAARIGPCAAAIPIQDSARAIAAADGLVNATALGMAHHRGSAFERDGIGPQVWAFDAVYTPTDTQFLRDCTQAGLKILSGFDLFRHMAVRSFQAYTGLMPDLDKILPQLAQLRPEG